MRMKRSYWVFCLAAAVLSAVIVMAQEPLPKAETVLDKYVEVTGGRAAYEKVRTRVTTGRFELVGKGIAFKVSSWEAVPNKNHTIMEVPGVGKVQEGTDGRVFWSLSALEGPKIKEGQEKAQAALVAVFNSDTHWRELFKTAETVGVEDVNGQPCYKLELTSIEGLKQTRYYDKKTGLLVKTSMMVTTQMGDIPTESLVSDYRKVDGVLMPFKTTGKMMGMDITATIDTIEQNVKIDESHFTLPDEVKALVAAAGVKL